MKQQVFYEEFNSFYYYSGSTQNWKMQDYHFHKEYEIILFLSEDVSISIGNRVYEAGCGDLFLIREQEYHKTTGAEGKEYRRFVLMFDPEPVERAADALGYPFTRYFGSRPEEFIHKLHLSGDHLEEIITLFERIETSCHGVETAAGRTGLTLKILELLLWIDQRYDFFVQTYSGENEELSVEDLGLPGVRERIEQIKTYVAEHVDEKLELDELAERFFISKYYLSHYFKKETGFTLGQYITNKKIARAKDMLKQGFTVTETAVALSYSSDSHFINTFKKMTGTTPKRYAVEKRT